MKNFKQIYLGSLAVILLIGGSIAFTGCNKENDTRGRNGSNVTGANQATSTDFYAQLLSDNVPFEDNDNSIEGYAWEWEIQRKAGQTGLSHFNFLDGLLCEDDEESGTLREHIVGAYYSQDGGSTWNNVQVVWALDGSTSGNGGQVACYTGEVLKINFGGDNIQVRLVLDEEFEVGVQYALFKRGVGGKNNTFSHCGIIEFAGPGCPVPPVNPCWKGETAFGGETEGSGAAWWFAFDTNGDAQQPIYAGQELVPDAYVTYSGGNFEITLGPNMVLDSNEDEPVKAQGYNTLPSSRPVAGLFSLYKGTSLTFNGNGSTYYVIHLDVLVKQQCD